jgi:transcriptional regulator with XRE-family HTH domain
MSTTDQLSTYSELAEVIDSLPLLVRERRRQMRLSVRAAAAEVGVAPSTLSRVENGAGYDSGSLTAILRWLDSTTPDAPKGGED